MTYQQKNKIAVLEKWLQDNPDHADRSKIETDLRNLNEQESTPIERDTFDLIEQNIYDV
jgi:hypothetical protein